MPAANMPLGGLPALPRDEAGPVFAEPWQAHAFAIAIRLAEAGVFTWTEWANALSNEIQAAQAMGDPDLGGTYYQHWLAALERLCASKGLVATDDIDRRKEEWRQAYLNTPHGQPITLTNAAPSPLHR
jgi:nitrile hydratase accessory protein